MDSIELIYFLLAVPLSGKFIKMAKEESHKECHSIDFVYLKVDHGTSFHSHHEFRTNVMIQTASSKR